MFIRAMNEQDIEKLRNEIVGLWEERARGDLPERRFQKQSDKRVLDLCRLLVRRRLGENNEEIRVEHHVVRAHTKIAGSVLRESEQEFISLLATEHRLFRLRAILSPNKPLIFRDGEKDALEELPFASISRVVVRTQRRPGEIIAGLVIVGLALLGRPWLQITSSALVLIGMAGFLHGLILPTRWAEIVESAPSFSPPFQIWALRKKSGRALLRFLRQRIPQV